MALPPTGIGAAGQDPVSILRTGAAPFMFHLARPFKIQAKTTV
jgi:hypothetical protein